MVVRESQSQFAKRKIKKIMFLGYGNPKGLWRKDKRKERIIKK